MGRWDSDADLLQTAFRGWIGVTNKLQVFCGRLMRASRSELVSKHLVTQAEGRNVSTCLFCHLGPDHPQ